MKKLAVICMLYFFTPAFAVYADDNSGQANNNPKQAVVLNVDYSLSGYHSGVVIDDEKNSVVVNGVKTSFKEYDFAANVEYLINQLGLVLQIHGFEIRTGDYNVTIDSGGSAGTIVIHDYVDENLGDERFVSCIKYMAGLNYDF